MMVGTGNWKASRLVAAMLKLTGIVVIFSMSARITVFGQNQPEGESRFQESYSYINNNRQGERLTISFPKGENDFAKSMELTLFEEEYFNSIISKYDHRMTAVFTGMGLGTTGLKMVVDDADQIEGFKNCLDRFMVTERDFRAHEDTIREKTEEWMGESWATLNQGRHIGEVYFYPSKTDLAAEFMWDFEIDRIWLSIGSRIMVENEIVPYILHMCQNLETYRNLFYEYRESVKQKNSEIDALLGIEQ